MERLSFTPICMVDAIALQCVLLRVLEYLNWPKTLYGSIKKNVRTYVTLLSAINYAANVVKQVVL